MRKKQGNKQTNGTNSLQKKEREHFSCIAQVWYFLISVLLRFTFECVFGWKANESACTPPKHMVANTLNENETHTYPGVLQCCRSQFDLHVEHCSICVVATALQHVIKITGAKRFENILQSLRIAKRLLFCCTILLQQALAGFSCASLFYAIALSRPLHHSHRDASKPNEIERNEKRRRG